MSTTSPNNPTQSARPVCAHSVARSLSLAALLAGSLASSFALLAAKPAAAQSIPVPTSGSPAAPASSLESTPPPVVRITVNSDFDGPIAPDQSLTLREAIEIANGTLPLAALSTAESALVQPASAPQINFALVDDTRIELIEVLPAITAPGLTIDGTTQPGYGAESDEPAIVPVLVPAVSITPGAGAEVFRGLTVSADEVTIRGLSLYGFSSEHRRTVSTPPADIFITHLAMPQGNDAIAFLLKSAWNS